jgi:hypothetical protein
LAARQRSTAAALPGLAAGVAGMIACGAFALHWAWWTGSVPLPRHDWLFSSRELLARDLAVLDFGFGALLFLVARIALRGAAAVALACTLTWALASASEHKMRILGLPVLPWDLWFAADLGDFADFLGLSRQAVLAATAATLVLAGALLWRGRRQLLRQRGFLAATAAAAAALGLGWWAVVLPTTPRGLSGQVHNIAWDQGANHANFGPFYSFVVNLRYLVLVAPGGPAADAAAQLDGQGAARHDARAAAPHVVLLLSESFTTLGHELLGEPLSCLAGAPRSRLLTPSWGGYTANVEFELLTGYPHALFPTGAVPYQMYLKRPLPQALPRQFADAGWQASAVHTFFRNFFARPQAYEMLGFSQYSGLEDLRAAHGPLPLRGRYVDDQVLFDEVLRRLRGAGGKPQLVHAVSMMAHLPYDHDGRYPVHERLRGRVPAALERWQTSVLQYTSMMIDHEQRLCRFLEQLGRSEERTLVLFYGDHYPSFGRREVYEDIHRVLQPAGAPLDIASQYARPPVALWDSRRGFVPLPAEVAVYNLGPLLLRQAGIEPRGLWAMPHKQGNRALTQGVFIASHQSSARLGDAPGRPPDPELEVLRAHAYRSLGGR